MLVLSIPSYHTMDDTMKFLVLYSYVYYPSYPVVPEWTIVWNSQSYFRSLTCCPSYPIVPWERIDSDMKFPGLYWGTQSYCLSYPIVPWNSMDSYHQLCINEPGPILLSVLSFVPWYRMDGWYHGIPNPSLRRQYNSMQIHTRVLLICEAWIHPRMHVVSILHYLYVHMYGYVHTHVRYRSNTTSHSHTSVHLLMLA